MCTVTNINLPFSSPSPAAISMRRRRRRPRRFQLFIYLFVCFQTPSTSVNLPPEGRRGAATSVWADASGCSIYSFISSCGSEFGLTTDCDSLKASTRKSTCGIMLRETPQVHFILKFFKRNIDHFSLKKKKKCNYCCITTSIVMK